MIEPLLTALETERHCRVPLLRSVLDELHDCGDEQSSALAAARVCVGTLLEELECHPIEEAVYRRLLASTRRLVEEAAAA
jgi:hypothetical protein